MQDGPDPSAQAFRSYGIKFLSGPREGETQLLESERTIIGRRDDCAIVVADTNVSSVHAEIIFESGTPVIRDLGSTNGIVLDDRRVDEVVLAEGDTFLLGKTSLQVVKIEASKPRSGAAESQRGSASPSPSGASSGASANGSMDEVRVIHDIRPGKRGVGSAVLLVILLLAVAGSAYYYFFHVKEAGGIVSVTPDKNNLAGKGWSFEPPPKGDAAADVWDLEEDSPARFSRTRGKARSGSWTLKSTISEGGYAVARRNVNLRVNPRRGYKVTLYAAIQGDMVVGVKARFFGRGGPPSGGGARPQGRGGPPGPPPAEGRFHAPIGFEDVGFSRNDDGNYHAIEGLVVPPQGAEEMELRIVAAGRGTAHVDDLEVREDAIPAAEPLCQGLMELRKTGGGFAVLRNKRLLMYGGRIALVSESEEGQPETLPSEASASGGGEGHYYAGAGAGIVEAQYTLGTGPAGFRAGLTVEGAQAAGCREVLFCFDLARTYAENGVGLFTADDFVSFSDNFPPRPAASIMFGGQHERIRITFEKETRVSGMRGHEGQLVVRCHLDPAPVIEKRFDIKCDFSEDYQAAQALLKDAARAESDRKLGAALELIGRIGVSYRFVESVFNEAEMIQARILDEKKRLLAEIQERLRSAVFLQNLELFNSLEEFCRECLALIPEDVEFTAALAGVREQSSELRRTIDDERAETMFNIAASLQGAGKRGATLSLIREYMESAFADSEWTAKVRELDRE